MKNIKKIVAVLLSMTAIASTTALAAVREDIEATYADGTASLAVTTANFSAAADDQLTVVIVPKDAEEITSGNIYYINQGAFEAEFIGILNEMKVKDGFGDAKDYEVRVGGITADGNYTVDTIYFKVEEEEVIIYGDVSGDESVKANDAMLTAQYAGGLVTFTEAQIVKAEVSGDKDVKANDAMLIAQYAGGLVTEFPVQKK